MSSYSLLVLPTLLLGILGMWHQQLWVVRDRFQLADLQYCRGYQLRLGLLPLLDMEDCYELLRILLPREIELLTDLSSLHGTHQELHEW